MTTRAPHCPESLSTLEIRLAEAEEMLRAIRHGEVDALVVDGPDGSHVYTLRSAEEPYRTLVEQMQEGALVLTGRGDITVRQCPLRRARRPTARSRRRQPARSVCARVRQTRRGRPDRPGQRSMLGPPDRIGFTEYRGEPVAHHDDVPVGRSPESDRDGSRGIYSRRAATGTSLSARTARRISSWRRSRTNCVRL